MRAAVPIPETPTNPKEIQGTPQETTWNVRQKYLDARREFRYFLRLAFLMWKRVLAYKQVYFASAHAYFS